MTKASEDLLREAYRGGLLTAARMVRSYLGERYGPNSAVMVDLDANVQAHKPTLVYVAESIERRAEKVSARTLANKATPHG